MKRRRLLATGADIVALAQRLSRSPEVTKFDEGEHQEAGTLAHAFADLEEAFEKFLNEQLPRLVAEKLEVADIPEILLEVGEEFRHILYHLRDPRFYRYLQEPSGGGARTSGHG